MNFDKMTKQELIDYINSLNEEQSGKYGIVWDKEKEPEQIVVDCDKYIPILSEEKEKNIDNDGENNLLIEGDNFHSLSVLNYTHKESVDVIYIDPPYNTGNKDFVYNDEFVNQEDGYRHSKWLNFMEKRLKLARNLLKNDGVIFISINDNEQANLKLLCDKIFGSNNFISNLVWTNNEGGGSSDSKFFKVKHEYVLCYCKDYNSCREINNVDIEDLDRYKLSDEYEETRGKYQLVKLSSASIQYSKSLDYPITCPDGTKVYPKDNSDKGQSSWRWGQQKLQWGIDNHFIVFKKDKKDIWQVYTKQYTNCDKDGNIVKRTKKPLGIIDKYSSTQGSNLLFKILNEKNFSYPKPVELIKYLLARFSDKNSIILDFFAGSGTTGHAVLELNNEDNGNRKFILCTNNENDICENITYQRIKNVIKGYNDHPSIKGKLKYYKTDFVENGGTRDQLYYDLTERCIPMLCVKSNTYDLVEKNKEYIIYSNENRTDYSCVYFDIFGESYDKFLEKIKDIKEHKNLYIFSLSEYINEDIFKGIGNYTIEPIPYKILDLYKSVVKMSKEN